MSDGMFYNQEITIDDINAIAHDIGHTTFNAVSTDKFGTDELNRITADLVTKGVLRVDGMCKPTKNDKNVIVATGVVVFADGAKIRLDTPQTINAPENSYIYAYEDKAQGRAYLCVSEALPINDDAYVRLARVDSYGNLADERAFCQAKANWNCTATQTVRVDSTPYTVTPAFADWELIKVTKASTGEVLGIYDRQSDGGFGRADYHTGGRIEYHGYNHDSVYITVGADGTITVRGGANTVLTICGGDLVGQDAQ